MSKIEIKIEEISEEDAVILNSIAKPPWRHKTYMKAIGTSFFFAVLIFVLATFCSQKFQAGFWISGFIAVASFSYGFFYIFTQEKKLYNFECGEAALFEADKEGGKIEVIITSAEEVVTVLQKEDEGDTYCCRMDQDSFFIIRLQDFLHIDNEQSMPSTHMQIWKLPISKRLLRLRANGNPLIPIKMLESSTDKGILPSCKVIPTGWEQVLSGRQEI